MIDEVPLRRHSEPALSHSKLISLQQVGHLLQRPAKALTLLALTLSVLSTVKTTFVMLHFAGDIVSNARGNITITLVLGNQPYIQIKIKHLSLVIEHLLKVRHEPLPIDSISMKAACQMIMDAPLHHLITGQHHMITRLQIASSMPVPQQ